MVDQVEALRSDPSLESPEFAPNAFYLYRRIAQRMTIFEDVELLALRRFTGDDSRVTRLLRLICEEVGYRDEPPLCVAISSQYYCAYPDFDLILMPQAESERLLTLPDLYHEIAHFVHRRNPAQFNVPNREIVIRHFDGLFAEKEDENWATDSLKEIAGFPRKWLRGWLEEFFCDLLAAFWSGPAYGFANMRLSANRGSAYSDSGSHPADDARHRAICHMLKLCGNAHEAAAVDEQWKDFCKLTGEEKPQRYDLMYPEGLLRQLAESVHRAALDVCFVPFATTRPIAGGSVTAKINQAWHDFFDDPDALLDSQRAVLREIAAR